MKEAVRKTITIFFICMLATTSLLNLISLTRPVLGQNTNTSGEDSGSNGVNPATGIYHDTYPLLYIPGRNGVNVNLQLHYQSDIWQADPNCQENQQVGNDDVLGITDPLQFNGDKAWLADYSGIGLGFDINMGRLRGEKNEFCGQFREWDYYNEDWDYYTFHGIWFRFVFEAPDGAQTVFVSDNPNDNTGVDDHYIALDTSGASLLVTWQEINQEFFPSTMTVVLANGIRYEFNAAGLLTQASYPRPTQGYCTVELKKTWNASWACTSIRDMGDDNVIQIAYLSYPGSATLHLPIPDHIIDTYGRSITFQSADATEMIDGSSSYPKARLTDISTCISSDGTPYIIHFTYQNEGADPYQTIANEPFDNGTRQITAHKKNADGTPCLKRVILQDISIDPPGTLVNRHLDFTYNPYKELNGITLPAGSKKTIQYSESKIASCYISDSEDELISEGTGIQALRVVTSSRLDVDGDSDPNDQDPVTQYRYLVYPNTNDNTPPEQDVLPQHRCFSRVVERHLGANKRIEMNFYSDTPVNVLYQNDGWRGYTGSGILSGMMNTTNIYEDHDFSDTDPGVLKRVQRFFYTTPSEESLHMDTIPGYYGLPSINPIFHYRGNSWEYIYPTGITTWQQNQSSITVTKIEAYGMDSYWNDFAGYRVAWQLKSDEFTNLYQDACPHYLPMFFVQLLNPTNIYFIQYTQIYQRNSNPSHVEYYSVGRPGLIAKTIEGDANCEEFQGWLFIDAYAEPPEYTPTKTTEYYYDSSMLKELEGEGFVTAVTQGLLTKALSYKADTAEVIGKTEFQYYTNNLPFTDCSYVTDDLYTLMAYYYATNNTGMLSSTIKYVRINDNRYQLREFGRYYYRPHCTYYTHSPLGDITSVFDGENNDYTEYFYDGYGREIDRYKTFYQSGNPVRALVNHHTYIDTRTSGQEPIHPYCTYVESTDYAGSTTAQRTITRTYYNGLGQRVDQLERSGDEPTWKTTTVLNYNEAGEVSKEYLPMPYGQFNPNNRVTTYEYDIFGRPVHIEDFSDRIIDVTVTTENWDTVRTMTSYTTSWGAAQDAHTDAQGRLIYPVVRDSANPLSYSSTKSYYDQGGRLWKECSREDLPTYYYYDAAGRLIAIDTPDETADFDISQGTDYRYPDQSYPTSNHADTLVMSLTLSGLPELVHTARGYLHSTYDGLGRMVKKEFSTSPNGPWIMVEEHRYGFSEDVQRPRSYDRIFRESYWDMTRPQTYTADYAYGDYGEVSSKTFTIGLPQPLVVYFTSDWSGRIKTMKYPNNDLMTFNYRGPRLTSITLNGQPLASAQYDAYRRLTMLRIGNQGLFQAFQYDNNNDRVSAFAVGIKYYVNDPAIEPIIDAAPMTCAIPDIDKVEPSQLPKEAFVSSPEDLREKIYDPELSFVKLNKNNVDHLIYQAERNIHAVAQRYVISYLLREQYTYGPSGDIHEVRDAAGNLLRSYNEDLMGRLTDAELIGVVYDPGTQTFTPAPGHQVSIQYVLDHDSLRQSKNITYDGNHDTHVYEYDPGTHRLIHVTLGEGGPAIYTQSYDNAGSVNSINGIPLQRDCLGQVTDYQGMNYGYMESMRIRRSASKTTTYSLYLGNDVFAEYNDDGTLIRNHYSGFGQRLATKEASGSMTYPVSDKHGDTRLIVGTAGAILWRGDYTPYGERIGTTPINGQIGYDGYLKESSTGLTYAYARDYDERTGAFLSMDPKGIGDNPYTYCSGKPLSCRDPTGLNHLPRDPNAPMSAIEMMNYVNSPEYAEWRRQLNSQLLSESSSFLMDFEEADASGMPYVHGMTFDDFICSPEYYHLFHDGSNWRITSYLSHRIRMGDSISMSIRLYAPLAERPFADGLPPNFWESLKNGPQLSPGTERLLEQKFSVGASEGQLEIRQGPEGYLNDQEREIYQEYQQQEQERIRELIYPNHSPHDDEDPWENYYYYIEWMELWDSILRRA